MGRNSFNARIDALESAISGSTAPNVQTPFFPPNAKPRAGEYYARWVDDFQIVGFIPVSSLFDHGFPVQASTMIIPNKLQFYVAGSKMFGEYGRPWDFGTGINWFPFARREMHVNVQGIYLRNSPVGGLSYPYVVGGNGWLFNTDFIVTF